MDFLLSNNSLGHGLNAQQSIASKIACLQSQLARDQAREQGVAQGGESLGLLAVQLDPHLKLKRK